MERGRKVKPSLSLMHFDKNKQTNKQTNGRFELNVIGKLIRSKNENSLKSFMPVHALTSAALYQIIFSVLGIS